MLFGPFRLVPGQQLLLEDDAPVAIGARAFDLLVALLARAGEVVGKEELMARVWPGIYVDESNLRVNVAGLRRALRDGTGGQRYIVNVPGRGYSFVAPVQVLSPEPSATQDVAASERTGSLPIPIARMVGRDELVESLCANLAQRRFVSLVGPGGIGKTTVAIAVAHALAGSYRDGVYFVDFSPIGNPQLVPTAIAAVLGLAVPNEDATPAVVTFLRQKSLLLVLDNCEHVIETATSAAELISIGAPGVHVLATSREPLRAAGERVHRLPPLENPSTSAGLTAAEALTFPGVQLFVERVAAGLNGFTLSDAEAPLAAEICQKLDGIALAIELAAGRVAAFGVRELAERLDDRFQLLSGGRRTALPRHQTLTATLEWSYGLLPEVEQTLLRRLAVFAGEFSLDGATAVLPNVHAGEVFGHLAELVSKSLVVADNRGERARYRLLETTRLYGLEKLRGTGELQEARRAHARYVSTFLAPAEAEGETQPGAKWLATYASQIDNVRAALDWAGSEDGDEAPLIELTLAAVPLWVQLSLMGECRRRVERALTAVGTDEAGLRARLRLLAALGWSLMYSAGASEGVWSEALDLADQFNDKAYRLQALWGVWLTRLNAGDLEAALGLAQQLLDTVRGSADLGEVMMADRLMATTLHYRGDQGTARVYIERMLSRAAGTKQQPRFGRFHVDQQVTAHYFQARILWLQGYADQALQVVERNIVEGQALGHALSFGSVLGQGACPIDWFTGDLAAARRHGLALLDHAEKHGLRLWHVWACCFIGLLEYRQGNVAQGLQMMRDAFDQAGDSRFLPRYMVLMGEFAAATGQVGDAALGLEAVDGIIARCERSGERWYLPELLRIKGDLLILNGAAARVEEHYLRAFDLADVQDAHAWQLRTSISLARLRRSRGRPADARKHLSGVLGWFSEGFGTSDLREAEQLLAEL